MRFWSRALEPKSTSRLRQMMLELHVERFVHSAPASEPETVFGPPKTVEELAVELERLLKPKSRAS